MSPAPSAMRICRRYSRTGLKCTEKTPRRDGWCGQCDGYTSPNPPQPQENRHAGKRSRIERLSDGFPDLTLEDVPALEILPQAVERFIAVHGGTEVEAEAQIRSLIEDIILMPVRRGFTVASTGRSVIATQNHDYAVAVNLEAMLVTTYRTRHVERSWAQVKAGVPSRLGSGRKTPAWLLQAVNGLPRVEGVGLRVTAFTLFLKRNGSRKVIRSEVNSQLSEVFSRFERSILAWNGQGMFVPDVDRADGFWMLVGDRKDAGVYVVDREEVGASDPDRG